MEATIVFVLATLVVHAATLSILQETEDPINPKIVPQSCYPQEVQTIAPVEEIGDRILGKMNSSITIVPLQKPPECAWAQKINNLFAYESCYTAMGFAIGVARCWGELELELRATCGMDCAGFVNFDDFGKKTLACQRCLSELRTQNMVCSHRYMGITRKCTECYRQVHTYGFKNCAMQCTEGGTKSCRECNDRVDFLKRSCVRFNNWKGSIHFEYQYIHTKFFRLQCTSLFDVFEDCLDFMFVVILSIVWCKLELHQSCQNWMNLNIAWYWPGQNMRVKPRWGHQIGRRRDWNWLKNSGHDGLSDNLTIAVNKNDTVIGAYDAACHR